MYFAKTIEQVQNYANDAIKAEAEALRRFDERRDEGSLKYWVGWSSISFAVDIAKAGQAKELLGWIEEMQWNKTENEMLALIKAEAIRTALMMYNVSSRSTSVASNLNVDAIQQFWAGLAKAFEND